MYQNVSQMEDMKKSSVIRLLATAGALILMDRNYKAQEQGDLYPATI